LIDPLTAIGCAATAAAALAYGHSYYTQRRARRTHAHLLSARAEPPRKPPAPQNVDRTHRPERK
jgi:hypothetical protein